MYKKLILGLLITSFSGGVWSASVGSTKITKILLGANFGNKAFLALETAPTNKAICNTNGIYTYVFDPTTEIGKSTLRAKEGGQVLPFAFADYPRAHRIRSLI